MESALLYWRDKSLQILNFRWYFGCKFRQYKDGIIPTSAWRCTYDSQLLPSSLWCLAADGWLRDKSSKSWKSSCSNSWVKVFAGPCDMGQDNGVNESLYGSKWNDWVYVLWIADGVIRSGFRLSHQVAIYYIEN